MALRVILPLCLVVVVGLAGCSDTDSTTVESFAGTFNVTWVATGNPDDTGPGVYIVQPDGTFEGREVDPGRSLTFTVRGRLDAHGHFTATSTPSVGEAANLSGTLTQDSNGNLSGTLTWAVAPPLDYRCTFTRQTAASPFAGTFQGTWAATTDPTDTGTSRWTFQTNGIVTGRDDVDGDDLFYDLIGIIAANGRLTSIETASDDGTAHELSGTLVRQADGKLRGILTFKTDPPTDYLYELTPTP